MYLIKNLLLNFTNIFQLNILLTNLLDNRQYNTIKLYYENTTADIASEILSNKLNQNHHWLVTNIDVNELYTNKKLGVSKVTVEETFYIHVFGNSMMAKFYVFLLRAYHLSFRHLLILYNNKDAFNMRLLKTVLKDYKLKIVVCVIFPINISILTTTVYPSNVSVSLLNDTNVLDSLWFNNFFSLNHVNIFEPKLFITGMIKPPEIVLLRKQMIDGNYVEAIGGSDGFIFGAIGQHYNNNVLFNTHKLVKVFYRSEDVRPYLEFIESPRVMDNSISTHNSIKIDA